MAKGDVFYIKLNWEGGDILLSGICNSQLISQYSWNNNTIGESYSGSLFACEEYVDQLVGTSAWQSQTLPYLDSWGIFDDFVKSVFPGFYKYGGSLSGNYIYYGDSEVPGGALYQYVDNDQQEIKFTINQNGSEISPPFPGIFTGVNNSYGTYIIREHFIIADDNFISNGTITGEGSFRILLISFWKRGENSYEVHFQGRGERSPQLDSFWTGKEVTEYDPDPDPFEPGGNTQPGGGGGSFDNTSTPVDIPGLPSVSAASTGFISLFNPTLSQLNDLASYLWSDLFEIDGWKKLFADPMDAILGLSILPVAIPSGGTREVKVGNIGTGISLTVAASQFVEVDCGSIDVNEYWGAYLDYEPYTQAQIFLPYIGMRPVSVDEIMGKTVRVVYHVDILTGACCCFVKCGDSVLYTYNGQCSIPIPITGANYTSVVNGVISIAASVGSLVATGGASAPTAVPSIASSAVNQMKPSIEKSGSISGSAGVLNMQTPYLILIRPRQALPSKQNEFIGYPSLVTVQLAELTGYTEVQSIHLENIPATQEELGEIQSLLEGGVIF